MAQLRYRANLSAKSFPLISDEFGRSVIIPQYDQNVNRYVTAAEDLDQDVGIPQIYYMHNVMPTAEGVHSIGYNTITNPYSGGVTATTQFKKRFLVRDTLGNKAYFAPTISGTNYILTLTDGFWKTTTTILASTLVTVTTINNQSYIYFQGIGCYTYNFASNTLLPVTLVGLDITKIIGITSSNGYLIAWSNTAIFWSSTVSVTDFAPSLITGAGGGNVQDSKGFIVICLPHTFGIIIYTTNNMVAAAYSGNSRFPFNLREITGSGGVSSYDTVTTDANSGNHFVYTTSGLQIVSIKQVETILPEITDFLSGYHFEDWDEITSKLSQQIVFNPMKKALTIVADRYLVISYGVDELTHAVVYDLVQKRFGKLKITHTECFEYSFLTPTVIEIPKKSLAFLQKDGTVKVVDFSYDSQISVGVLLLGKYQLVRSRFTTLYSVDIESARTDTAFSLQNLLSIDGKNTTLVQPTGILINKNNVKQYGFKHSGMNHTIVITGGFNLNTIILTVGQGGKR